MEVPFQRFFGSCCWESAVGVSSGVRFVMALALAVDESIGRGRLSVDVAMLVAITAFPGTAWCDDWSR